jgi:hypothetical protein
MRIRFSRTEAAFLSNSCSSSSRRFSSSSSDSGLEPGAVVKENDIKSINSFYNAPRVTAYNDDNDDGGRVRKEIVVVKSNICQHTDQTNEFAHETIKRQ